jgi:hypothetical protein
LLAFYIYARQHHSDQYTDQSKQDGTPSKIPTHGSHTDPCNHHYCHVFSWFEFKIGARQLTGNSPTHLRFLNLLIQPITDRCGLAFTLVEPVILDIWSQAFFNQRTLAGN